MAISEQGSTPQRRWRVQKDPESLARDVADFLLTIARQCQRRCAVSLAGGSTPRRLYTLLASEPWRQQFPWPDVHWFWGDERFVPHDHPASNYRMVREALLSIAPIPEGNIHPIPTQSLSPQQAASQYELTLKQFYGAARLDPQVPLFDVTLLGLGEDGHTASLFPGQPALNEHERWVVAVLHARAEPRITLTFKILNSSRNVAFLVAGAQKRQILARLADNDPQLPATHVRPAGELLLFCDEAAAPFS